MVFRLTGDDTQIYLTKDTRVMLADLLGHVRDRLAFRQFHDHGLEQEREPAVRTRPWYRPDAMREARHARHIRVDERLVLEEVQMTPHTLPQVIHWACLLAASLLGAVEARARLWKPIVMFSSRLLSVPPRNSTPDTIHGSGNCKAEVNSETVSIPPNYSNALTSKQPSPTLNSERFEIL